jgi:hypothetical protein
MKVGLCKTKKRFFTVEDIGYGQRAYKNGPLILFGFFLLNENSVIF